MTNGHLRLVQSPENSDTLFARFTTHRDSLNWSSNPQTKSAAYFLSSRIISVENFHRFPTNKFSQKYKCYQTTPMCNRHITKTASLPRAYTLRNQKVGKFNIASSYVLSSFRHFPLQRTLFVLLPKFAVNKSINPLVQHSTSLSLPLSFPLSLKC